MIDTPAQPSATPDSSATETEVVRVAGQEFTWNDIDERYYRGTLQDSAEAQQLGDLRQELEDLRQELEDLDPVASPEEPCTTT